MQQKSKGKNQREKGQGQAGEDFSPQSSIMMATCPFGLHMGHTDQIAFEGEFGRLLLLSLVKFICSSCLYERGKER